MRAGSCQHMMLDQRMDRGECHTRMANQVNQGRQTNIHSFAHKPLGLTVQRLVLAARHCPRVNRGQGALLKATIAIRYGPAHSRGMAWKGAGGWLVQATPEPMAARSHSRKSCR